MNITLLILSLPTENATIRQRIWRILKACGAGVLRDGVYALPRNAASQQLFNELAADIVAHQGSAYVLAVNEVTEQDFLPLFDRSEAYAELLNEVTQTLLDLSDDNLREVQRASSKLRKRYSALVEIDFYPNGAQTQLGQALQQLELACSRMLSPDEPHSAAGELALLSQTNYQGQLWATRRRPWIDRLASAWLILRFIDPQAQFVWLAQPSDCPAQALGFDFDGATFSHIGNRVTFEVLLARFQLPQLGLNKLAQIIHYLDVGGVQPAEASGLSCILAGLRDSVLDDDQLLAATLPIFDGLLANLSKGQPT